MTLRILSLGAGVQSSTVFLMSLYGDLPPFDHVIFADTGWEPADVYTHLAKLQDAGRDHSCVMHTVSAGNIRDDHVDPAGDHLFIRSPRLHPEYLGKQRTFIPFFVQSDPRPGNLTGKGKTFRTCTKTYKIEPVEKQIRTILGLKPNGRWPLTHVIDQTFGISWDESERMRDSPRPAIVNQYPLIDMRMTRDDCHEWLADHGWTAPRSACVGCPFHRNDEWRRMRDHDPEAWEDAVEFDATFRARQQAGLTSLGATPYLHDSRVPLDEADIDKDRTPIDMHSNLFGEECEGLCGT